MKLAVPSSLAPCRQSQILLVFCLQKSHKVTDFFAKTGNSQEVPNSEETARKVTVLIINSWECGNSSHVLASTRFILEFPKPNGLISKN